MRKYFIRFGRIVGITTAVCFFIGRGPSLAATKVIGNFEGNMGSPYTVPDGDDPGTERDPVLWFTDTGITVPSEFVSINDVDYEGGVTRGNGALRFTFPPEWGTQPDPYLRLHGQEQLMDDIADYPYLLFDVTTFAPTQDPLLVPEGERPYRQMFANFNLPPPPEPSFFYDANYDSDIQREIDIAQFGDTEPFTDTVVVDMTAPLPVNGDGMNVMNVTAQFYRTNHNDGTPIPGFVYQLVWVFQGRDLPFSSQIEVIIDNVRFCNDSLETCLAPPAALPGDYNNDQKVDAADYVIWRNGGPLLNETASPGMVDQADYVEWKAHFGTGPAASSAFASGAIPEPTTVLLALVSLVALSKLRRARC